MTTTSRTARAAPPNSWDRTKVARWAGGLYLAYILANVLASLTGHIGLSDAQTLCETIADNESMFRIGLVAALVKVGIEMDYGNGSVTCGESSEKWQCDGVIPADGDQSISAFEEGMGTQLDVCDGIVNRKGLTAMSPASTTCCRPKGSTLVAGL